MILLLIGLCGVVFATIIAIGLMQGSSNEQAHYESIYQKYLDEQKKKNHL